MTEDRAEMWCNRAGELLERLAAAEQRSDLLHRQLEIERHRSEVEVGKREGLELRLHDVERKLREKEQELAAVRKSPQAYGASTTQTDELSQFRVLQVQEQRQVRCVPPLCAW